MNSAFTTPLATTRLHSKPTFISKPRKGTFLEMSTIVDSEMDAMTTNRSNNFFANSPSSSAGSDEELFQSVRQSPTIIQSSMDILNFSSNNSDSNDEALNKNGKKQNENEEDEKKPKRRITASVKETGFDSMKYYMKTMGNHELLKKNEEIVLAREIQILIKWEEEREDLEAKLMR